MTVPQRNFKVVDAALLQDSQDLLQEPILAGSEVRSDPRLVFLLRAAARLMLVEAGEMGLDEAYDDLIDLLPYEDLVASFPLLFTETGQSVVAQPKGASAQAPQSTIDTLTYELQTYGISQLEKPNCLGRLADLSTNQGHELIAAMLRLQPRYPAITDELILKLGDCYERH